MRFGIVFGEADPPFAERAKVERVVRNALVKPMRLCRLNLISSNASRACAVNLAHSATGFGIVFGRLRRGYDAPGEKAIHLDAKVERVVLNTLPMCPTRLRSATARQSRDTATADVPACAARLPRKRSGLSGGIANDLEKPQKLS